VSSDVLSNVRRYRIVHRTAYDYHAAMTDGYTVAHLLPRDTPFQTVEHAELVVDPEPAERDEFVDVFGNRVAQFGVHGPHDGLVIEARSTVTVVSSPPLDDDTPWELVAETIARLRGDDVLHVGPFRSSSQFVDLAALGNELSDIAASSFLPGRGIIEALRDLCHRIFTDFTFDPTSTDLSTPLADVLATRSGVCQDFAHLASGCLRSVGLAARYVSGYIETQPPPGQQRLVGADMSHAWCSVWTPAAGWIDFDPTNDHVPVHRHVTLGWGRDYADISPVRGVVIGPASHQTMDVSVDVAPVV
jgi:transglutaminase-like putative cysteine protease